IAGSRESPKLFTMLRSSEEYRGPRNELRPTPGGVSANVGGSPTPPVLETAAPPPGKLLPVRKARSLVLSPAPPKYCVGRIGPKNLPLGCRSDVKVFGVQGKPECMVQMPFSCHPPSIWPTQFFCSRNMGKSHVADSTKLCVTS